MISPNSSRKPSPQRTAASTMRRRRASSQVRCAMVRMPFTSLPWPLVASHDVDEIVLERTAATADAMDVDPLRHQPAGDLRHQALGVGAQVHDAGFEPHFAAELL